MTGRINSLLADEAHNLIVSVIIDKLDRAELRKTVAKLKDVDIDFEIKKHVEKRTLSANAYMWVLIGKIAEKLNLPKDEVYRKYIYDVGVFKVIEINNAAADTFVHAWNMHGKGWVCEKVEIGSVWTLIHAYYGSSVYNKKQMARLIDAVVQDAVNLDIEVKTPDEIAEMVSLWESEPKH